MFSRPVIKTTTEELRPANVPQQGSLGGRVVPILSVGAPTLGTISVVAYAALKFSPLWVPFLVALGPIGWAAIAGGAVLVAALVILGIVYATSSAEHQNTEQTDFDQVDQTNAASFIVEEPADRLKESVQTVLSLQKQLHSISTTQKNKEAICKKILSEFKKFENHYLSLHALRKEIDKAEETGTSKLFHLIYHDVDANTGQEIIRLINRSFEKEYGQNPNMLRDIRIYTDIDDTIKDSLNDRDTQVHGLYPGVQVLYRNLALSAKKQRDAAKKKQTNLDKERTLKLTVLSARPEKLESLWKRGLAKDIDGKKRISCLLGSTKAAGKSIKHYTIGRLLRTKAESFFLASERVTYRAFAQDKRQNIDRDLLLWPEARAIMFGDTGEGDLLFMLKKNNVTNVDVELPVELPKDPRIPAEYYLERRQEDAPINTPNTPLFLGFAHAISSRAESEYRTTISGRNAERAEELQSKNIYIIDNFVDAAVHCYNKKLIDRDQVQAVVKEVEDFLVKEHEKIEAALKEESPGTSRKEYLEVEPGKFNEAMDNLSPFLRYRLRLIRSIDQAFKKNAIGSKHLIGSEAGS